MTDARTKDGEPIAFRVFEQDPADLLGTDRGFVVHRIEALVGGVAVGYVKASYIPRKAFRRLYRTPWHFLGLYDGHVGLWEAAETGDPDEIWRALRPGPVPPPDVRDADLASTARRARRSMRETRWWAVDKPVVAFIHVNPEWQRRGIGLALYEFAARWLARERCLPLYASTVQSDEAKAAWERMRANPALPVLEEENRYRKGHTRIRLDFREGTRGRNR